jgi:hypothetical protein
MTPTGVATIEVGKGVCYALFAYEVGLAIKLDEAERRITAMTQRFSLKRTRRAPHYFEYRPAPLRVTFEIGPMVFADFCSSASVDAVLYDFGAISVAYRIPLEGAFHRLLDLNEALYDNAMLVADSRSRVDHLLATIGEAVERPSVSESVEDYVIFQIEEWKPASTGEELYTRHARDVTQVLRCERQPLSEQEVQDALSCRISFGPDDVTIIDWNTGLLFGRDTEDERAVLEFANVELLEMRHLDQQLDRSGLRSLVPANGLAPALARHVRCRQIPDRAITGRQRPPLRARHECAQTRRRPIPGPRLPAGIPAVSS